MASCPLVGRLVGWFVDRLVGQSVGREPSFFPCQLLIPPMLLPNPHSFICRRYVIPTCPSAIVTTTTSSHHLPLASAKVDRLILFNLRNFSSASALPKDSKCNLSPISAPPSMNENPQISHDTLNSFKG